MLLTVLAFTTLASQPRLVPATWHAIRGPFPASRCSPYQEYLSEIVDTNGKYLYTSRSQIDLMSGLERQFSAYEKHVGGPIRKPTYVFCLAWTDHPPTDGRWKETGSDELFYAANGELGYFVQASSISGLKPAIFLLEPIGGPIQAVDRKWRSYLRPGFTWWVQAKGPVPFSIKWPMNSTAIVHGARPDIYMLPKKFSNASALQRGVIWDRKLAYVRWRPNASIDSGFDLYLLDFSRKTPTASKVQIFTMPKGYTVPTAADPLALADGSLCTVIDENNIGPPGIPTAVIYTPNNHKWTFYKGLAIYGSSQDGKLVAYSLNSKSQFYIARTAD